MPGHISFRIEDTGIGMSQELVDFLEEDVLRFEAGTVREKCRSLSKYRTKGSGLGMTVTKILIRGLVGHDPTAHMLKVKSIL